MTMAVPVRPPRAIDLPRSCRDESGRPKVAYTTRDAARRVARDYRRVGGLHAYLCAYGCGYHIGRHRTVR